MDDYYASAGYQEKNIWETLEQEGDYTVFLRAAELAGYRPYLSGKGITTVMAANDSAFALYLKQHDFASIDKVPLQELKELIGFHLLYYSYNKGKMENFRPEGQSSALAGVSFADAGLYYKFRTHSSSPVSTVYDDLSGKTLHIYHLERFLPVFSHFFFETKGIDAKSNYEYFYPTSTWSGDKGFNASSASITQYEQVTCNGYIYKIDRVLEPLETIYAELQHHEEYSDFLRLYDRFSSYEYDASLSADYGKTVGADSLYLHNHQEPLAPIALEWPVTDYQRLDTLSYKAYSVFAPSNAALKDFTQRYWAAGGYASIDSLDPLILSSLLSECVYGGSIVFPEEITTGKARNSYGQKFNIVPEELPLRRICINGSLYGIDHLQTPVLFGSVVGKAFADKNYICSLYALKGSGLLNTFASQTQDFTLLLPDNEAFNNSHIVLSQYTEGNRLELLGEDGSLSSIGGGQMTAIIREHYAIGSHDFPAAGSRVIPLTSAYTYWFVKDGTITDNSAFNQLLTPEFSGTPFVPFYPVEGDWNNGKVYTYHGSEAVEGVLASSDATLQEQLAICNDSRYAYANFAQLLKMAGLVNGKTLTLTGTTRYIVFAPSNEAIQQAIDNFEIPGIDWAFFLDDGTLVGEFDKGELQKYLLRYFVDAATISDSPYVGSGMKSGEYHSLGMLIDGEAFRETLVYTDDGTTLSIRLKGSGQDSHVVGDYFGFPFVFSDGCLQLIDGLIN